MTTKVNDSHAKAMERPYLKIARIAKLAYEENGCKKLCEDAQSCRCRRIAVRIATTFALQDRDAGRPITADWSEEKLEWLNSLLQQRPQITWAEIGRKLKVSKSQLDLQLKKMGIKPQWKNRKARDDSSGD